MKIFKLDYLLELEYIQFYITLEGALRVKFENAAFLGGGGGNSSPACLLIHHVPYKKVVLEKSYKKVVFIKKLFCFFS